MSIPVFFIFSIYSPIFPLHLSICLSSCSRINITYSLCLPIPSVTYPSKYLSQLAYLFFIRLFTFLYSHPQRYACVYLCIYLRVNFPFVIRLPIYLSTSTSSCFTIPIAHHYHINLYLTTVSLSFHLPLSSVFTFFSVPPSSLCHLPTLPPVCSSSSLSIHL